MDPPKLCYRRPSRAQGQDHAMNRTRRNPGTRLQYMYRASNNDVQTQQPEPAKIRILPHHNKGPSREMRLASKKPRDKNSSYTPLRKEQKQKKKHQEPLKVLHWNINGLRVTEVLLNKMLHEHEPDVVMLQGTNLTEDITRKPHSDYNCVRLDRTHTRSTKTEKSGLNHGGVITLSKKGLDFSHLPDEDLKDTTEAAWLPTFFRTLGLVDAQVVLFLGK